MGISSEIDRGGAYRCFVCVKKLLVNIGNGFVVRGGGRPVSSALSITRLK